MAAPAVAAPSPAIFSDFTYAGHAPVNATLQAGPDDYINPILAGFHPDPSIVRVNADYYLVNSTFSYFPGIPVFHSRDLVHWTQIGNAIDRPSQLKFDGLGVSEGVFAPDINYHDGVFYIINTCIGCGGNYVITAKNPAGPWSDPVWLSFDGIDPSLFIDDDGRAYIINNGPPEGPSLYDGHRAIWIQAFDLKSLKLFGPRTMLINGGTDISKKPQWIEGPHMLRRDGRYYIIAAEGGTGDQHSEVVFGGASPQGPFTPYAGNPILTQRDLDPGRPFPITSAGHAQFVKTQTGDWWAVFLATRPYKEGDYNTGRETFLAPIAWRDGWPRVTAPGQGVAYLARRPGLPAAPAAKTPTAGDFTLHDSFTGAAFAPAWMMLRTPHQQWWRLSPQGLIVTPRPDSLSGKGQPAFLGQRLAHPWATITTTLRYAPAASGDEAGLAAFQNEDHYYVLGEVRGPKGLEMRVERRAGAADPADGAVIASESLSGPAGQAIKLRIEARGGQYDFAYAAGGGPWRWLLKDADGTILSTRAAGGFVGTMVGPYARLGQ